MKDVKPRYPAEARRNRIQGIIIFEVIIGTDGRVRDPRVLHGVDGLTEAALEAVQQWVYTPTLLEGEPVDVVMTVTTEFRLPIERGGTLDQSHCSGHRPVCGPVGERREPFDWKKTLEQPLSPGSIALLVENAGEPEVQERWRAALHDTAPRYAGRRAMQIYAANAKDLVPALKEALATEENVEAARGSRSARSCRWARCRMMLPSSRPANASKTCARRRGSCSASGAACTLCPT